MSDSATHTLSNPSPSLPQAKAQLEHDILAYAYAVEAGDVLAASINISNAIDALIAAVRHSGEPQAIDQIADYLRMRIDRLSRIVPSELEAEEQMCRNGEYVSLFDVHQLIDGIRPPRRSGEPTR